MKILEIDRDGKKVRIELNEDLDMIKFEAKVEEFGVFGKQDDIEASQIERVWGMRLDPHKFKLNDSVLVLIVKKKA